MRPLRARPARGTCRTGRARALAPPAAALAALCVLAAPARAQRGDHAGEAQPPLPADLAVPAAPALSAADEARTLRVAAGLAVELVACEPLVEDPVACVFDADGSLWVVEMRGYMPDVDGKGEDAPVGRVAHLFDDDGDGRMDRRQTFLDGLVLPRAVAPTRGGVLVIAPPKLLFASDEDGDGVADEVRTIDTGLAGLTSPEHAINALLPTLDNAFHCADAPWRYVWRDGHWLRQRISAAGQWGATKDDLGRIYTDNNSDPLRVDEIDAAYAARNPALGNASGVNLRVVDDPSPRPARMNTGVNRGYQPGQLDAQWHLASVTGACAPWIARGTALGAEFRGNAFVCEPCGNLVLRYRLFEDGAGHVRGTPLRNADGLDFLTSTDERFRPVGLCDGPDGALYVCDLYRGLIQHRLFVTSWLRQQVVARGLEQPIGRGRIWRVAAAQRERAPRLRLESCSASQLAAALESANGWTRDTAQRLLVEEHAGSAEARRALETRLKEGSPLARVHALWALAGLGALREEVALGALRSELPGLARAAVAASEHLAWESDAVLREWSARAARGQDAQLVRQVLLSLGNVRDARGLAALLALVRAHVDRPELRSAAASGLGSRELDALALIAHAEEWREAAPGRAEFVELLARCLAREGRGDRVEALLALAAGLEPEREWLLAALARGVRAGRPKDALGQLAWVRLPREPELLRSQHGGAWDELADALAWPGKPGTALPELRALSEGERARFERGRALYESTCAQCHLDSGLGQTGQAPPLRGSKWVLGSPARTARILLGGLRGALVLDGEEWDSEMPAVGFSDAELAAVLTYVRREWGNGAEPVEEASVRAVREATRARNRPWSVAELEALRD